MAALITELSDEQLTELLARLREQYDTALEDTKVKAYINKSYKYVCKFTSRDSLFVIENLSDEIIDIAIERINTKGAEGLSSQSNSGASETYINDISKPIKAALIEHRRLRR